ncbi:MAG: [protein-PII] uridylyltransferase [Proteobacteria bacterium]|nr:MAG: [protein-PII] uridylyltransferase [Pseudomonadota bacterium]
MTAQLPDPTVATVDHPIFAEASFDLALAATKKPIPLFRKALAAGDKALRDRFLAGVPASELVPQRAVFIDQLLVRAWGLHLADSGADIALIAVGGYGRGELHPASDIDVMILLRGEDHDRFRSPIEDFITLLWDIGLEVGHSVRSLTECVTESQKDITVATNLMEARLLAGTTELMDQLSEAVGPDHLWPSREFFEAKWREQQERYVKYHETAYNLEPNIKEGPGGLRDIQMIGWVAKRYFRASALHDLVTRNFLTESEYRDLIARQNYLWDIRFALHILTGRREDRLLFDHQRALARQFGYQDDDHRLAVEKFMKRYYRTIMELSRLNEMLLQLFQEVILYADDTSEPEPINRRFQAQRGFIEVTSDDVFRRFPYALLEVFLIMEQRPDLKGVRATTIRLIRSHRHLINDEFRRDLRAQSLFMEILRQPQGITHELRRMNRYGVLAAYIPAFENIVGQMQYDLFHVYTVDEHTLRVIRNLRRFTVAEHFGEFPHCSEISQRIPKMELLYLAGLFHDIGKGRRGDHSKIGADEALRFCEEHHLSAYDAGLVSWLVANHLVMSLTAQRRDISDPEVITAFAHTMGDQDHLDYLFLLTVADIRATNPTIWNSWKNTLLHDLYTRTKRALRRGLEIPIDRDDRLRGIRAMARAQLRREGLSNEEINSLWRHVHEEYVLRCSVDELAWQTKAIVRTPREELPLVLVRPHEKQGGTVIFIYTRDSDRVFAQTTSMLDQLALTIADARIMPTNNGYTLDTYLVLDESGTPVTDPFRLDEIRDQLRRMLAAPDQPIPPIRRRIPRQLKHFTMPSEIHFNLDEPNNRTVLELFTSDRPGLLSSVGKAFAECGVRLKNAKIATFGARAEDIFYITDNKNQPLSSPAQFQCLTDAIHRYLDG